MATGPKHYEIAAEILSALADDMQAAHIQTPEDVAKAHLVAAQAQAHATLALTAATVAANPPTGIGAYRGMHRDDFALWSEVIA